MLCIKCHTEKDADLFGVYHKNGERRQRSVCIACYAAQKALYDVGYRVNRKNHIKKYAKKNYNTIKTNRKNRVREIKEFVDGLKTAPCTDCKRTFPPVAMDFDHVRGRKKLAIATMINSALSIAAIEEELAKCELVCACCHRIRTAGRADANS